MSVKKEGVGWECQPTCADDKILILSLSRTAPYPLLETPTHIFYLE